MAYRRKGWNKYNAKPVRIDGIRFASSSEGKRYKQLKTMYTAGFIKDLELQPRFKFEHEGKTLCTYVADFQYIERETGDLIIEEIKGKRTEVYKLKLKMMKAYYPEYFTDGTGKRFIEISANDV